MTICTKKRLPKKFGSLLGWSYMCEILLTVSTKRVDIT